VTPDAQPCSSAARLGQTRRSPELQNRQCKVTCLMLGEGSAGREASSDSVVEGSPRNPECRFDSRRD